MSAPVVAARPVHQVVSERYQRFYAPLALACATLPFLEPFERQVESAGADTSIYYSSDYGTLWDMASDPAGGPAIAALLLTGGLVLLLVIASFARVRSPGVPLGIAGIGLVLVLMLITKPNTDEPPLSTAGAADLVIASCLTLIALAHAIQLVVVSRQD